MRRLCRPALSTLVALAVAGVLLLPPSHLHRAGIEGRTEALVHAHAPDAASEAASGSCQTGLTSRHGDHHRAVFLSADLTPPRASSTQVLSPGTVVPFIPPAPGLGPRVRASDSSPIHGPPLLVPITRGPPSLS